MRNTIKIIVTTHVNSVASERKKHGKMKGKDTSTASKRENETASKFQSSQKRNFIQCKIPWKFSKTCGFNNFNHKGT